MFSQENVFNKAVIQFIFSARSESRLGNFQFLLIKPIERLKMGLDIMNTCMFKSVWRTNRTYAAPMIISHTSLKTNNDITLILGVH